MLMTDIILKKKDKKELTKEEIEFFVNGYTNNEIPDYQMSSLLMAIVLNGMTKQETADLTIAMINSGDVIDLSNIAGIKVDKHSTGGVGDKTSLVLGPMLAACGAKVAKMSGRGLGHTGGTLDKLESIPNFKIEINDREFIKQVEEIGIAIIGQTKDLVPADKKIYALRDITGTVESIPLMASSIMSKKLASGSDCICLDVKYGSGAFMKTPENARELAEAMIEIGKRAGRKVKAVISTMDQPLGFAIGNNLEVKEAIATLNGEGPSDLLELCLIIGSLLLVDAKLAKDKDEAREKLIRTIENKTAIECLRQMVKAQSGDDNYITNPNLFAKAIITENINSNQNGYLHSIDTLAIGLLAMELGAGRRVKEDIIDFNVGLEVKVKIGDLINEKTILSTVYANNVLTDIQKRKLLNCFIIKENKINPIAVVNEVIE